MHARMSFHQTTPPGHHAFASLGTAAPSPPDPADIKHAAGPLGTTTPCLPHSATRRNTVASFETPEPSPSTQAPQAPGASRKRGHGVCCAGGWRVSGGHCGLYRFCAKKLVFGVQHSQCPFVKASPVGIRRVLAPKPTHNIIDFFNYFLVESKSIL